jgi:N-glycosylase/DNA lyase
MLQKLKAHHKKRKKEIEKRLGEFRDNRTASDSKFLEEMAFCVFAANSSAKMGLKAVELLKDVMDKGNLADYKKAVYRKVRFYNKRAEYLHHNKEQLKQKTKELKKSIMNHLHNLNHHERRIFIRDTFKGFGMKESSHLLRNLGYEGYCIIDKHVLNTLKELDVLKNNIPPKNEKEYMAIEKKLIAFAKEHQINIDELDLAIWSWKTGEILK